MHETRVICETNMKNKWELEASQLSCPFFAETYSQTNNPIASTTAVPATLMIK